MENKDHIEDDLRELAPNLFKIKKENPFEVPKDYFDTLPMIIQEHCVQSKKNNFSWLNILFKPAYSFTFLMGLVIIIAGIGYMLNTTEPVTRTYSLSADSLEIESVDESMIIEELASVNSKSTNDVEEYLIDENIESSQIESEL